jgi:DUF4097 and DUF4098 domain-containing protein YvlB
MKRKASLVASGLALVLSLQLGGLDAAAWEKTVPASDKSTVEVKFINAGLIKVVGWDKNEVKVETDKGSGLAVRADGDRIRIGGRVRAATKDPVDQAHAAVDGLFGGDMTIHLPKAASFVAKVVNGSCSIQGVAGKVRVSLVNGDVETASCEGPLELRTVSGSVKARTVRSTLSLKSVSGSLSAEDVSGPEVSAKTISGNLRLRNFNVRRVRASSHSGEVELQGQLPADGSLAAKSFSGNVTVLLPAGANFEVNARSRSGQIEVKFPLKNEEKAEGRVSGKAGEGGPEVRLSTFSGNLTLKPGP